MKEIVVLSGKGGTGKTILVASFAALAQDKVMADCDVDAADLYLLLQPSIKKTEEFWSGKTAVIDKKFCTGCGVCEEVCRFGAIKNFKVDPISCEGCGFCFHVCPEKTVTMRDNLSGHWFISDTRHGPLVHARLGIAQENSGKLVAVVRQNAKRIAEDPSRWEVYVRGGRTPTGLDAVEWAARAVERGAGEVLLTSMDADGTLSGYDLELTRAVAEAVPVPVIASGGAGCLEHFAQAVTIGKADAALAASLFHDRVLRISEVKEYLVAQGIPVRLASSGQ